MKKSDLPWILPLLTALNEGKTIQILGGHSAKSWIDCPLGILPSFTLGEAGYRIKPELKTPFEVYIQTTYPSYTGTWGENIINNVTDGLNAVIKAYKAGELILPEDC